MKLVPFLGAGIAGKSYAVTRQRRVNCYLENRPDGDKTQVAVYGTPGLVLKFTLAGIVRGLFGTQSNLYAVSSNTFYSLTANGVTLYSATLSSFSGVVSMAQNPTQVLVVDGTYGYIFSGGALNKITSAGFPNGAKTCTFVSGYFVVEQPGTQQFWVSNLLDGSTWNALAFASAYQYSDNIVAVDAFISNLILFSERHIEFWQVASTTPVPFAPILSATSEYGLAAIFSRAHIDNSICFVANNPQGTPQVCRMVGYQIGVISTPDLDNILASFGGVSDMVALSYVTDGHPMYQITSPSASRSFLYDCSTGIWSETQTGLSTAYAQRHAGNLSTYYAGATLISDYSNGNVYTLSSGAYTDNGTAILREIVSRHASENFNVFSIDEVYLDMETGVGLPAVTTGSNYLAVPGTAGNYVSTPNSVASQITGNIDVITYAAASNWATGANQSIIGKFLPTGNQRSWALQIGTAGALHLVSSPNGVGGVIGGDSTTPVPFSNGNGGWLRANMIVNDGAGNHVYNFYYSNQSPTTPITSIVWIPLGATVTVAGTTSIFAGTSEVDIGIRTGSLGTEPFNGRIYVVAVYNIIGSATPVIYFSANDTTVGATSWTSSRSGEVYTALGTASVQGNLSVVQGPNPQVSLECSKDNGRTFGPPLIAYIGAIGNYLARVIWRRFGSARDFVFRIRMTDPVKFVITAAALSVRERQQ